MRSSAVLSVAFVAAAISHVMSAPVAGGSTLQPTPTMIDTAPLNPTAPVNQTDANLIDEFLSTLSEEQLQDLLVIVQGAMNSSLPMDSPMPTGTVNSTQHIPNQPEKRQWGILGDILKNGAEGGVKIGKDVAESAINSAAKRTPSPELEPNEEEKRQFGDLLGILGKESAEAGAKVGKDAAESAIKSALKRTASPAATPAVSFTGELNKEQKRQLGDLFGLLGKDAAKAGLKVGKDAAESAIKSALKRTPAPTPDAKRWWSPPPIPTPPPVPSCWHTGRCGIDDLD